jgi:hypothetical protein
MAKLQFEKLELNTANVRLSRAKIPGGWLLLAASNSGGGLTFYPDPQHKWDGNSLADDDAKAAHATPGQRDSSLRRQF